METALEYAGRRFSKFALDVLQPAVWRESIALEAHAAQFPASVARETANAATFRPVQLGWHWGPAWSTCWFRLQGSIPSTFAGRPLALRFSSGTEATLWSDDGPVAGFDRNRDAHLLGDQRRAGQPLLFDVEAACNHPFGTSTFWWDPAADRERWDSPTPGRFDRCEIALFDPIAWRLWRAFEFARLLLAELARDQRMDSPRGHQLCDALTRAYKAVGDREVAKAAPRAIEILEQTLRSGAAPAATRCVAVGHAHIDTAWLWPIRETRRKCIRSWANTLRLMERFPEFHFLCSQAQQYAWVEQDAPALFNEIKRRVREHRWEPLGAMWIEPDCSCPSGESFIRQILHGVGYWREKFGDLPRQRLLYLPDTFGFPATLPQIMKLAGIDTFITNKMSWNERNEFPFMTFRWRGLDGSEVLTHFTPGHDYNASNTPLELRRGETNCARKDQGLTNLWLQPFGFGDGGGGPTDWQIQNAVDSGDCEGLPRVELGATARFLDDLHGLAAKRSAAGESLPVWDGEMYLELHRGTFTSQSRTKRANRQAEQRLRIAEWLAFAGPNRPADAAGTLAQLDEAWKITLLNQFHDILPGSSIAAVYEDAQRDHAQVDAIVTAIIDRGLDDWSAAADTSGLAQPVAVFNPTSSSVSAVVRCENEFMFAADVPAMGVRVIDRAASPSIEPVRVDGRTICNGIVSASIDDAGRVASLRLSANDRETCAPDAGGSLQPLNQLMLYEDRPRSWEAWDIDADYPMKPMPVDSPAERIAIVEKHPLRCAIEVERSLGARSRLIQRYSLDARSPRLDVETRIDWREDHRLLRALFPVDVRSRVATYDIQFGHIQRSTARNTSHEQAMFEMCAHHWMDISEHGFGVALLNDCKYGHSCEANVMGLTLLRSPKWPDASADMGEHDFTYSIMPHAGEWREVGVDRQAALLNAPLILRALPVNQRGTTRHAFSPFDLSAQGPIGVTVAALKRAEETVDDRLILRLVETHGGRGEVAIDWRFPVNDVTVVDLLERPTHEPGITHDCNAHRTTFGLRPFQIVTLAIDRA